MSAPADHHPEIGVMLYDNPKECKAGWASIAGAEAMYMRSHADLANHVIWVTNSEFSAFQMLGHRHVHNLRGTSFFRTPLYQMAADLGIPMAGHFAKSAAQQLAKIAMRILTLGAMAYEWKPGELFNADALHENIKSRFPRDTLPNDPRLEHALRSAYQTDSAVSRADFVPNSIFLTLRMNRLLHAKNILACPIPDDGWGYLSNRQLPVNAKERLAMCLNSEAPVLAEVVVDMTRADAAYGALAAFGQKVASRMVLREWVSHPELIWLAQCAPIEIRSVFKSTQYQPLKHALPTVLSEDPLLALSYSAGLLAENHWTALASDEYNRLTKKRTLSSRAVWLRAADRAFCFALAKYALDQGFAVTGYSSGAVRVRVLRAELLHVLSFAIEHGLVCPDLNRLIQPDDLQSVHSG
ncbi:hypothetical protein [Candidatus Glomeribacter gigasporarum]|nr:hypothetical protein [Candidatus Glomeribacter gigasporarum]